MPVKTFTFPYLDRVSITENGNILTGSWNHIQQGKRVNPQWPKTS